MKYNLLIFDLDNTVFDYSKAENAALDRTLFFFNCPVTEEIKKSYRIINEQTWQRFERGEISSEQLRVIRFEKLGETYEFDWDANSVSTVYLKYLGAGGFLMDGALKVLDDLRNDFRLAALTNGISDVQRARLSNSPVKDYFDPVVISDEVGIAKPDPAIFELLLKKAGISDKKKVLMIGDGLSSDIAGAVAAGIDACWYNPGSAGPAESITPDYEIRKLSEVVDIVYRED